MLGRVGVLGLQRGDDTGVLSVDLFGGGAGTSIAGFNASPEPVVKGKIITVKGKLFRYMAKMLPGRARRSTCTSSRRAPAPGRRWP